SRCDRRSGSPRCGDSSRPERSGAKENHRWLVENREDSAWQIGFLQLSEGILRSPSRNGKPQPVGPPVSNDLLMAIDVLPWMRGSSEVLALVRCLLGEVAPRAGLTFRAGHFFFISKSAKLVL